MEQNIHTLLNKDIHGNVIIMQIQKGMLYYGAKYTHTIKQSYTW